MRGQHYSFSCRARRLAHKKDRHQHGRQRRHRGRKKYLGEVMSGGNIPIGCEPKHQAITQQWPDHRSRYGPSPGENQKPILAVPRRPYRQSSRRGAPCGFPCPLDRSGESPAPDRKCGGRLEKLVSASAIQFKGSGWYVTDYAGNGRKAAEKAESDSASSKDTSSASDDKKSEKSEKSDKKTKESSPAKKTSEKASTTKAPSGD